MPLVVGLNALLYTIKVITAVTAAPAKSEIQKYPVNHNSLDKKSAKLYNYVVYSIFKLKSLIL